MTGTPSILLLAAGASRRMQGRDKQLEPVRAIPMLRHICQQAVNTGTDVDCYVTLPDANHPRARVIDDLPVTPIFVDNPGLGLSASLVAGVTAIAPTMAPSILVCPTDLPDLTSAHFDAILTAQGQHPNTIIRAQSADGVFGHPVAFPRHLFAQLAAATGDQGPKHLFQTHPVRAVQFDDMAPTTDLDTPQAWARWRKNNE